MLSLASAVPFLAIIGWLILRRRFLIYVLLLVLIAFAWRLASVIYIDIAGPLYADELFRPIGGGRSALVLGGAQVVTLLAVLLVFTPIRLSRLARIRVEAGPSILSLSSGRLGGLIFGGVLLFLLLLFLDLARGGVIPLLAGIEEYVFIQKCAGRLHGLLVRYGDFLSFYLGLFYANGLLLDRKPDRRFLLLFLGVLLYMLLAGNRFSALYRYATFFLMPLGVVVLQQEFGPPRAQSIDSGRTGPAYRRDVILVAATTIAMIVLGTTSSLFLPIRSECAVGSAGVVVSSQGALAYLRQRVLVQQGELWWATYERIFLRGEFDPGGAFRRVFINPVLHPRRNSTIPYLMERAIGDRSRRILEGGSQYTGGFPEIFFELFGKVMAYPAIFVVSFIFAWLIFALVRSMLLQRAVRTFLVFYVAYAFIMLPVTGMVNFLVREIFWLKVAALSAWLVVEPKMRDGRMR